ncbi:response regulator transcription factor [Hoeflea prorocentri]|uniref:Response regulator transcription factor n=1 Tax=Hoeflea prorocentri TaxID=1922333 RepID=A0A9X3UHS8_9HYPH|nr:response regulator transcription factor [Hoeflea prorocentri]MCY6380690.1 response regulator transcription factor [Hoeflea prorocentri]MDA5398490.1 response regulator transcription factor [Hoeflea prorocentri]
MSRATKGPGSTERAIVFVGPNHNFAECIETALINEIEDLVLERRLDFKQLFHKTEDLEVRVCLIVIDETLSDEVRSNYDRLRELFPTQILCLACNETRPLPDLMNDPALTGLVESFLPMNLRLDIWLSAVRLMMNGGDYIPRQAPAPLHTSGDSQIEIARATKDGTTRTQVTGAKNARSGRLTSREIDVLKLVARGYQNKVVAAELELSENTIKLHMHHIIEKLGVGNRTEAAAVYFGEIKAGRANGPG